jgi:hypothetical protein
MLRIWLLMFQRLKLGGEYTKLLARYECGSRDNVYRLRCQIGDHFAMQALGAIVGDV